MLALRNDGTVWAWGEDRYCELGNGYTAEFVATPAQVSGLSDIIAVSAFAYISMALRSDGTVWMWGANNNSITGQPAAITASPNPHQVEGLPEIRAISVSTLYALALAADGQIWSWGFDEFYGCLGDGPGNSYPSTPMSTPRLVANLTDVIAMRAGGGHSIALCSDGSVWLWGATNWGEYKTSGESGGHYFSPIQVTELAGIINIGSGHSHSFALDSNNRIWTWGHNLYGPLGNGSSGGNSPIPTQIAFEP